MKTLLSSSLPLPRRRLLAGVAAAAAASAGATASAQTPKQSGTRDSGTPHKIVYQLNQADEAYREAIFNSISAMLKKYVDDISITVVVWGPGIHLLAKAPQRPVSRLHQQRVRSMAQSYGIKFIACGNTIHSLGWTPDDMLDFATVEDVGAASIMELQEQGYAYLAW